MERQQIVVTESKLSLAMFLMIGIVIVLLGTTVALGAYVFVGATRPTARTYTLVNEQFNVQPGHYHYYSFNAPSMFSDVRVTGSFVATGSPVEVLIMSQVNYDGWQINGIGYKTYDSGSTYSGSIDVSLQNGATYYLIYENASTNSSYVTVQTTVSMQYRA